MAQEAQELRDVAEGVERAISHIPRLVTSREAHAKVHGTGGVGLFNNRLALWITKSVGTMWCAYLFAVLGGTGIAAALTNNTTLVLLVGSVSGYFLQLVLLPIIIVGQNVQAEATDARAEADHETLHALHTINVQQLKILRQQQEILEALKPAGS